VVCCYAVVIVAHAVIVAYSGKVGRLTATVSCQNHGTERCVSQLAAGNDADAAQRFAHLCGHSASTPSPMPLVRRRPKCRAAKGNSNCCVCVIARRCLMSGRPCPCAIIDGRSQLIASDGTGDVLEAPLEHRGASRGQSIEARSLTMWRGNAAPVRTGHGSSCCGSVRIELAVWCLRPRTARITRKRLLRPGHSTRLGRAQGRCRQRHWYIKYQKICKKD